MSDYPTYVDAGQLDGETGFNVIGGPGNSAFGTAVASIGDVNGDGFDDFIISAPYANYGEGWQYVIFGTGAGFPSQLSVATLDGANGFRIVGGGTYTYGRAVSAAGDLNGDGFGDFMVGHPGGYGSSVYVIFGRDSFAATLDLGQFGAGEGMVITGPSAFSNTGDSLASGDFNGDGFVDLLIGATGANGDSSASGAAYVVFGHAGGYPASFSLAAVDGVNGFKLAGYLGFDLTGRTVSSAGDVNHDGIDDILVGAPHRDVVDGSGIPNDAGYVYVVFGSRDPGPASVSLAQLDGTNGFTLHPDAGGGAVGRAISSAGDFNGDGNDDLLIGSAEGAWVVFGKAGGFAADIDLTTLDGTDGFKVADNSGVSLLGTAVSGGGDFNGDGFDDLIVGASGDNFGQGAAYLIFGGANGTFSTIDVGAMVPGLDTKFTGGPVMGYSVAFAGDINGDGFDDLLMSYSDGGYGGVSVVLGRETSFHFTGGGGDDVRSGGSLEDTLSGGLGDDTLSGLAGADVLNGDDGDDSLDGGLGGDWLEGGTGADAMTGGTGDDTFVVDDAGDTTLEAGGEGRDVVRASLSWTLAANIETLILEGAGDIDGTGNSLANTLNGNSGANRLDGGDGDDMIKAGGGGDTLLGGLGADQLLGQDGNDSLDGGDGNDRLDGGNGDDGLSGGIGADILDGGADNDTLDGGTGNDQLLGGAGIDSLTGGDGNDSLDGGAGADSLAGGLGDDVYYVDDAGDTVTELAGQGADTVRTTVSFTLSANVENLILDGSAAIDGTGHSSVNAMTGNANANTLDGLGGDDVLKGMDGNDILIGGTGSDIMVGGNGADTFVIRQESIKTSGAIEADTVNDLNKAQGDKLDLSAIDADSLTAGDQAFHLVGAFSHHAGEMTLTLSGSNTLLALDVDGDGRADYRMTISGNVTGDSGGWLL